MAEETGKVKEGMEKMEKTSQPSLGPWLLGPVWHGLPVPSAAFSSLLAPQNGQ